MKMSFLLMALLLASCGEVKTKPLPLVQSEKVEVIVVNKSEFKKLLRACHTVQIPQGADQKAVQDVAIDLANARKASLEECNLRLQKARERLGG